MSSIDDLLALLRAELDEDERTARAAETLSWPNSSMTPDETAFLHRQHPGRVLVEVEVKRQIVEGLAGEPHYLNDRYWYGCRAVTEHPSGDPDLPDVPTGLECTCGRDARVEQYLRLLARPYAGRAASQRDGRL